MKEINGLQILIDLRSQNCFDYLTLEEIIQKLGLQNNQCYELKIALDELIEEKLIDCDKETEKYKINKEEFDKLELKNL